ncbi:MAG TPA: alpha-amylase family glycosyl hydrolase [Candidatus Dormibacteraeota bacterium]|jgi:glycosidase
MAPGKRSSIGLAAVLVVGLFGATPQPVTAAEPVSVTIAGSLQSELGCPGDWDPGCAATHLSYDANSQVWRRTFVIPSGNYDYKAALNDSWDENYGLHATRDGANIALNLSASTIVTFYYDHKMHWVTDNHNSIIATAPGSFQSELGCAGDWDPGCLRSWLQDPAGTGTYSFTTTALPQGAYEAKVAINESWDENYGQGGTPNGANIAFSVAVDHQRVTFTYDPTSHLLTILVGGSDNNIHWDGLRHDSRDTLYRTPGGAVPAGASVSIRFRTFHNDVTSVTVRVYDLNSQGQQILPMSVAASDVSCYQAGLESRTCDFWATVLTRSRPDNLWYRFIVRDGAATAYYADDTPALDGGVGNTTADVIDQSYALMFFDPTFVTPAWAQHAVIYQIFPDRFRKSDDATGDSVNPTRYDDPAINLSWGTLPEGYCRDYAVPDSQCPWRFDSTRTGREQPRGRDYYNGDLEGISQKLPYLRQLGIDTIYLNPIFAAMSNHRYDTADYKKIDPRLGTLEDFRHLVREAKALGIRIILDGVFNHMSSDSPNFDRYQHYATVGACESAASSYRSWFTFRAPVGLEPSPCAPTTPGGSDTYYNGWFGFDSIPVLNKSNAQVKSLFVTGPNSVSRYWLDQGVEGWRLDVMGDPSFPDGYWESFRQIVKEEDPSAIIVGELWQKDSTLLRYLRGDRADTTMDYRFRDAVVGFLAPQNFDSKGFADSGHPLKPSEVAARLQSIREDYPDAAYYSLMNLLDSHDTERIRWTLTPGVATPADRDMDAANVANGKQRVRLASLIQFTVPGSPTVYYGDEVGMTGATDPDDRRTYPWTDTGGQPDASMLQHYQRLAAVRKENPVLSAGDFRVLLADDAKGILAYGRKTSSQVAVVAINRGSNTLDVDLAVGSYVHDAVTFDASFGVGNPVSNVRATTVAGKLHVHLNPMSGLLLLSRTADLVAPSAPTGLAVTEQGNARVGLMWNAVAGAASYRVYRSPLPGGGYVLAGPATGTTFTDTAVQNARKYFYVVRALDAAGNESAASNEVTAVPHLPIGWANLQWPPSLTITISALTVEHIYGQVYIAGLTDVSATPSPTVQAQLGVGPVGSSPVDNAAWTWTDADFNLRTGNNHEYVASITPDQVGTFNYLFRYTDSGGAFWTYADLNGPLTGPTPAAPGVLTVQPSSDTTAPPAPTGLVVTAHSANGISLQWDAAAASDLFSYDVLRGSSHGGPYTQIASVPAGTTSYVDSDVIEGATYYYVVRAVDNSFNRSGYSNEVSALAELRTVTVVFTVSVPATTPGNKSVYIAGTLDRLDGGLPQWDPAGVVLTKVDSTHWTITLTGKETTQIEYKYTLGSWDFVEKDGSCGEINNRMLTLSYGSSGTQDVNDTVPNWRNVPPCGN